MLFDLRLLFLDGVDENHGHAVVLHAFDFTFVVVSNKQRLNLLDLFRAESQVFHPALFPIEGDRRKTIDEVQTRTEPIDVGLVA